MAAKALKVAMAVEMALKRVTMVLVKMVKAELTAGLALQVAAGVAEEVVKRGLSMGMLEVAMEDLVVILDSELVDLAVVAEERAGLMKVLHLVRLEKPAMLALMGLQDGMD